MTVKTNQHKFHGLDSLRGLAAVMVIFQHFWEMNNPSDDRLRPWLFFCAGHEAVILFFVLSGFVLSNQLRNFTANDYGQFVLKRIFRIYPAYYVAIGLSALLLVTIKHFIPSTLDGHNLTDWFYVWSQTIFDKTMTLGSITLIYHEGNSLDVATWSLFYEMWLSLAFPVLLWLIWRSSWITNCITVLGLFGLSCYFYTHGDLLGNAWQSIIYYSWYFILGLLIYHLHERIKPVASGFILILGVLFYFSNYLLFGKISNRLVHEIIISFGSAIILINGIHNEWFKQVLNWLPFRFYGKISYSLYLFHLPVLFGLSYLLLPHYSTFIVKISTFIIASFIAALGYYLLELPSINLINTYLKSRRSNAK